MARQIISKMAAVIALTAAISASEASAQSNTAQITVLYDAFGKTSTMTKDWGFAVPSSMAASVSCSTPATTRRSSRTMSRPRVST